MKERKPPYLEDETVIYAEKKIQVLKQESKARMPFICPSSLDLQ